MKSRVVTEGPLLLFGGPYSNLEATRALLVEARRRGIPTERVICTGDVVAYCADPKATVDVIRRAGIHTIMGNCEEALAERAQDCGCGFAPGSACDRLSTTWFAHADRELGPDERSWMASLPRGLEVELAGSGLVLTVVHGSLSEINRFVFASTPERIKALDLALSGTDGIVAGHCGLPFSQVIGGRLWHNPGVIGMPANDGTPRVCFSVLTPGRERGSLTIEHACLDYDHATTAAKMRARGLPEGYADALGSGLWPNCDVLPPAEATVQGVALEPTILSYPPDRLGEVIAWPSPAAPASLNPAKFRDPVFTVQGERRAQVSPQRLQTLWINTGTLCNLACSNCYIESTPRNDRLAYITAEEVRAYLDEIEAHALGTELIGFTGGEPFMNRELPRILRMLSRGASECWS